MRRIVTTIAIATVMTAPTAHADIDSIIDLIADHAMIDIPVIDAIDIHSTLDSISGPTQQLPDVDPYNIPDVPSAASQTDLLINRDPWSLTGLITIDGGWPAKLGSDIATTFPDATSWFLGNLTDQIESNMYVDYFDRFYPLFDTPSGLTIRIIYGIPAMLTQSFLFGMEHPDDVEH